IPIAERHHDYAERVGERLRAAGLRAEADLRAERMNAMVRDAQLQKVPYMLVVGDKEAASETVSVRLRTNANVGSIPLAEFMEVAARLGAEHTEELWPSRDAPAARAATTTPRNTRVEHDSP
ncbi:MAG TPA: His/Gly/Thr/Pro-type tRNA ligase C-terminal domain-containing protein, partial [Ktedonobacterales bacterium]|nr:His/Gly/Thr/Pro-type tRNA ligase C-terminal domain-containing protein [Ktedonobacterales bacterium]